MNAPLCNEPAIRRVPRRWLGGHASDGITWQSESNMISGSTSTVLESSQRCVNRIWLRLRQVGVEQTKPHRVGQLRGALPPAHETFVVNTWWGEAKRER